MDTSGSDAAQKDAGGNTDSDYHSSNSHHGKSSLKYLLALSLGALGVVYGDIGTSPLYALRECFSGHYGLMPTHDNVLGVLSLIFWSLIIVVTIKYLVVILRADNDGEGGILALMALVKPSGKSKSALVIVSLGIFGASLLYGDGIITPAISVLSAVEGLNIATPFFEPYVIPLTVVILFCLFAVQKKGTGSVGKMFGPITLIWFVAIGLLGIKGIASNFEVIKSVNPYYAVTFFTHNGFAGFIVLGSVFLVITGGEALYADMGHFGRKPIRIAWFAVVLPCLFLNYLGQGALMLQNPSSAENPFYLLAPQWALYPMVILATFATVIASQALISGAFSLTFQAVLLGYLPRVKTVHTSEMERGQIYIPHLNWALFVATIALVLSFKTSSNLAAAYGIAVTTTMVITTILAFFVMTKLWKWSKFTAIAVTAFFFVIDVSFFGANLLKFFHGGYVPIAMGAAIYIMMMTWHSGRKALHRKIQEETHSLENFIDEFMSTRMVSIPGAAVYMSSNIKGAPPPLILNIKHNKLLHKLIVILTIKISKVPRVKDEDRITLEEHAEGFYKVIADYGFMEAPDINKIIELLRAKGVDLDVERTTFFLGRETLIVTDKPGLRRLKNKLFVLMSNNAQRATEFFKLPINRVFEVGSQVEI
ncbi:MAG: potassium transporter Kup [Ignavibacteria bacterium]|nr:potassium transporter Kup [Ignavibacteria bacterium]